MSQEQGTTTLEVRVLERTYRVECICEFGTDYSLVGYRERLHVLADGTVIARDRNLPNVRRSVLMVQGDSDAMAMLGLVKTKCDQWSGEDLAALPPPS